MSLPSRIPSFEAPATSGPGQSPSVWWYGGEVSGYDDSSLLSCGVSTPTDDRQQMSSPANRPTVLFTGGGGAGQPAVARLLAKRWDVHLADADPRGISPEINSSHAHDVPMARDPRFADSLVQLAHDIGANLIVPGVDEELTHVAELRSRLAPALVLSPEAAYIRTMLDKLKTAEALATAGLDHPTTTTLSTPEVVGFPCFAKPRWGRGSRGIATLHSRDEAAAYVGLSSLAPGSVVAQELLTGVEYTVQMIADRSQRLHAVVPVRVELKRGVTIRAEIEHDRAVIDACLAIHNALPASGCYNIQLMRSPTGRVTPFEINPRVSTTFCMTLASQIDPLQVYMADEAPTRLKNGRHGLGLSRYWRNHIAY